MTEKNAPRLEDAVSNVIDSAIVKLAENAENGRIDQDAIPFPLWELAILVQGEMEDARYGNHFDPHVASSLLFLKRFCLGETYEGGKVPLLYLEAFKVVSKDWSRRCMEKTGESPIVREDVGALVSTLYMP
jgi:hypothetical protein